MPTKYQPLVDYLRAHPDAEEIILTFAAIEAILGGPLSVTAQVSPSWWSGRVQPHTRTWRALGWRGRLEQRDRCVHFTRPEEE